MIKNNVKSSRHKQGSRFEGRIENATRLKIVLSFIFVLGFALIIKLFVVQFFQHDYYLERANRQHDVFKEIEPVRGRVFIQDNPRGKLSNEIYPIATNKDFVEVYSVPKDILDKNKLAEQSFVFFKKEKFEKEIADLIKKEEEELLQVKLKPIQNLPAVERLTANDVIRKEHQAALDDKAYKELIARKKEMLLSLKKDEAIKKYLDAFSKENDPYELIEKKVDEKVFKDFFLSLVDNKNINVTNKEVELKSGKVVIITRNNFELKVPGLGYDLKTYRFYPESNNGAQIIGFTDYSKGEQHGNYGIEGFFDEELFGKFGSIKAERGAGGLMITNNREYNNKVDGSDFILTIDRSIQFQTCLKLKEAMEKHRADKGSVIVMDPYTGEILALCGYPDFDPNNYQDVKDIYVYNNQIIFDQYESGSVMKSLTMAAAINEGKVTPQTTYLDEGQIMINGWHKPIGNSDYETFGAHGVTNMVTVLELSLNTGAIFAMKSIGAPKFAEYINNFGFGEKTGIELEGEASGDIRKLNGKKITEIDAATAAFGQGVSVTPIQMTAAYAVLANGGLLVKPYIVKEIVQADGSRIKTEPQTIRRVISEETAATVSAMLINVVENGHSKPIKIPGYYIAGKTGTAQAVVSGVKGYSSRTNHTFAGFAPAEKPKFVILTRIDNPKDAQYAESTAVPLAKNISEFILNYWEVPKNREITTKDNKK